MSLLIGKHKISWDSMSCTRPFISTSLNKIEQFSFNSYSIKFYVLKTCDKAFEISRIRVISNRR